MTTSLKYIAGLAALGFALHAVPASAASVGAPHLTTPPAGVTLAHYGGGWRDRDRPWWKNSNYGFNPFKGHWRRRHYDRWSDGSHYRRDRSDGYRREYYGRWDRY